MPSDHTFYSSLPVLKFLIIPFQKLKGLGMGLLLLHSTLLIILHLNIHVDNLSNTWPLSDGRMLRPSDHTLDLKTAILTPQSEQPFLFLDNIP